MTKLTRYFLFGSVGFVVLGLTVGLVGYYGGLPGLAFVRAVGPVELQYVPADAAVVAYRERSGRDAFGFPAESEATRPDQREGAAGAA